eukprot:364564-Chlamydomonas_euryale.AAC.2
MPMPLPSLRHGLARSIAGARPPAKPPARAPTPTATTEAGRKRRRDGDATAPCVGRPRTPSWAGALQRTWRRCTQQVGVLRPASLNTTRTYAPAAPADASADAHAVPASAAAAVGPGAAVRASGAGVEGSRARGDPDSFRPGSPAFFRRRRVDVDKGMQRERCGQCRRCPCRCQLAVAAPASGGVRARESLALRVDCRRMRGR